MKSKVFKLAHLIKGLFQSFSQALKAAWKITKLSLGKKQRIVFAKEGGEVRTADAIACASLSTVEKGFVRFLEQITPDQTQWRSFRIERMIL